MANDTVSVITPTYNRAYCLGKRTSHLDRRHLAAWPGRQGAPIGVTKPSRQRPASVVSGKARMDIDAACADAGPVLASLRPPSFLARW